VSYHAYPRSGKWILTRTGGKRALKRYDTEREAWKEAKTRAASEHVIAYLHDHTGRIVKRVPSFEEN
jgi:hypothetical protein